MSGSSTDRAWGVLLGAVIAHAVPFGLVAYTFTVFFPPILEDFGASTAATAWIVGLATALMLGASSLAGVITDRFGPRRVMFVGGVVLGAGLVLSASAGSILHIVLTYGLIGGAGASMTFVPAIAAVGRSFDRLRGFALGVAAAGSGIGTILLAPLASYLIEEGGWRRALRLLGFGAGLALAGASALMPAHGGRSLGSFGLGAIVRHRAFRLIAASSVIASFGYWVPFFFIAPYARDHGIGVAGAAGIVAVMGVANTLGRIVMGAVADRIGRVRVMKFATLAMAITICSWPFATSVPTLVAFALAYGIVAGTFIALLPAVAGDYFGAERLGGVSGLIFASAAVGTLLSAPLSGALIDAWDSYTPSIVLAAATLVLGAIPILMLPDPTLEVAEVPA